jgi:DNA-binding GntR family transcriptional regulator
MSTSLSQQAYQYIQGMLLSFELNGATRVSEHTLAKKMRISRTPVREAIRRLQDEGVLYQVPSSGTYVSRPSRKQVVEMYELRLALEVMAVAKAARRMTRVRQFEMDASVERMRAGARAFRDSGQSIMEGEPLRQFLSGDLDFHRLIMTGGANTTAYKIINDVHVRHAIFGFRTHRRNLRHVARALLCHARVAAAVHRQDPKAARKHLRAHIRQSLRAALAAYDAAETTDLQSSPQAAEVPA